MLYLAKIIKTRMSVVYNHSLYVGLDLETVEIINQKQVKDIKAFTFYTTSITVLNKLLNLAKVSTLEDLPGNEIKLRMLDGKYHSIICSDCECSTCPSTILSGYN